MEREIVGDLLAGTFEEPLSSCVLRQRKPETGAVYEGFGLLLQDADRTIRLRVFSPAVAITERLFRHSDRGIEPGELIPDSEYYDFVGTDSRGRTWKAERISISPDFGQLTCVRARPLFLERSAEHPPVSDRPWIRAFIPGAVNLPWHALVVNGDRGQSLARFEKKTPEFAWTVEKADDGVWLDFQCAQSPITSVFQAFLRGMSVLTGVWLRPILLSIYEHGRQTTRLMNRLQAQQPERLLPPIPAERPYADDAHRFLDRYLAAEADDSPAPDGFATLAYRFWHRILMAHKGDIENSSLVLSVAVEGLVKETLLSNSDVDEDFLNQVNEAKPILKRAAIGPRALGCVLSSLGNARQARVQDTLRRLAREEAITDAHVSAWKSLRHAAAHGGVLEDDEPALQHHLRRFHTCLDLYYRLLFLLIGYKGGHTNYSATGWPRGTFNSVSGRAIADHGALTEGPHTSACDGTESPS